MDAEFADLCAAVRELLGLRLEAYQGPQLQRRLGFFCQRHGLRGMAELTARLRRDPALARELAGFLTINVSEFFRDGGRWDELVIRHLPPLLGRRRALQVWSAGSAAGAEIYTAALLLQELAPGGNHQLLATDIDAASLRRAASGVYYPQEVRGVPEPLLKRYFRNTGTGWELAPEIRRQVTFRPLDLLQDPYPADQDLILCRNVVIYFRHEVKSQVWRGLAASLRPGGILFAGGTETILGSQGFGLRYLSPCFYQRGL